MRSPHHFDERGNRPKSRKSNFPPSLQFQSAFNKSTDKLARYSVQRAVARHRPIPNGPSSPSRRRRRAVRVSFQRVTCTPSPRTTSNLTPPRRTYAVGLSGHVCTASVPLTNLSNHPEPVSRTLSDPADSSSSPCIQLPCSTPRASHIRFNVINRNARVAKLLTRRNRLSLILNRGTSRRAPIFKKVYFFYLHYAQSCRFFLKY